MQSIESFVSITRRVIARDGFDGYLPTLMLPATQEVLVLEGAPQDATTAAITRRWAEGRAGEGADFVLSYKVDKQRFAVLARIEGFLYERLEQV